MSHYSEAQTLPVPEKTLLTGAVCVHQSTSSFGQLLQLRPLAVDRQITADTARIFVSRASLMVAHGHQTHHWQLLQV